MEMFITIIINYYYPQCSLSLSLTMKVHCQEFCNLTNILSVPMKMSVTSMPPHLIIELSKTKKKMTTIKYHFEN